MTDISDLQNKLSNYFYLTQFLDEYKNLQLKLYETFVEKNNLLLKIIC